MRPVTSSAARVQELRFDPVGVRLSGGVGVRQREVEVARPQRQPRERVLPRRDVRKRLVQRAHDRGRRSRERFVGERFEHERQSPFAGSPIERMNVSNSAIARGSRFARISKTPRYQAGRSSVGASSRQRFPAVSPCSVSSSSCAMRVARSAGPGVVGQHGRGEKLARGGLQVLALERDVAEQRVRVHVDLGVGTVDRWVRSRSAATSTTGSNQRHALHAANITSACCLCG